MSHDVVILGANHFEVGLYQKGAGYRYHELALHLGDHGLDAAVMAPKATDFPDPPVTVLDQSQLSHDDISQTAEVFVFCLHEDPELVRLLRARGKTLIYDSFLSPVEGLTFPHVVALGDDEKIAEWYRGWVGRHNLFNELADYFLVGQPEEKLMKLGELINTHQVRKSDYLTLGDRILPLPVLTYSGHHQPQRSLAATSNTMVWNGGLWNHYTGTDLIIDAVEQCRAAGHDVSFTFLYPNDRTLAYAQIKRRIEEEGLTSVTIGLPGGRHPDFFAKQDILAGCRAVVLLYEPNLLLHIMPSMRLREVMLFEKPIIVSAYGAQAAFVEKYGIGLTVENTVPSLRAAMQRLTTDEALYAELVENIRRMKGRYEFEQYVPAIVKIIQTPVQR